jgi:hypothetical protein
MSNVQYLPPVPELIELDMRALFPEDYPEPETDLDEFQMRAEHQAIRDSMKRKNQRMRHHIE